MEANNKEPGYKSTYPWKSFLVFSLMYVIGLASYYPSLIAQAKVYIEIIGETTAYTANQLAGLSLIQPFLIGILAIYFGSRYLGKINLRSLIVERVDPEVAATTNKSHWFISLKESVPFIVIFAAVVAALHLGFDFIFQNWLPTALQPNYIIPNGQQFLSNLLYSGLGQEIMLRYGIMTVVIYVFSSRGTELNRLVYILGIVFTAVIFAFAQYNGIFGTYGFSFILILRMVLLTGLSGFLFGTLFYKFHVEAALLAHMLANLLIVGGNILIVSLLG